MGNQLSGSIPSTTTAGIGSYIDELVGPVYHKSLGSARFLKTTLCFSSSGPLVIKILVKPSSTISFRPYVLALKAEQEALKNLSNVFPYQWQVETERAIYVVRQYLPSSLYDRLSTRPFLNLIEKKFLAFQLLRALADIHERKICHGDIKTENIIVTSWNWAYLCDFANFKPTYLPEDNPADFSFFFDTASRRSCYLSPERFFDPLREPGKAVQANASQPMPRLQPAMDVFALGCVIGELFVESSPTFLLSQLLSYKRGEFDPSTYLQHIECPQIRSLVAHMIQLKPGDRLSASEYLKQWCVPGGAFPAYFHTFLYPYLSSLADINVEGRSDLQADARIGKLKQDFYHLSGLFGFTTLEGEPEDHIDLQYADATPGASLAEEGAVLLGAVLMPLTRNCLYPSSQISGLSMLQEIGKFLPDSLKLDRLVPYLVGLSLESDSGLVRAYSIKVLVQVLDSVKEITPINASLFSEYLLPQLRGVVGDSEVVVRVAYAREIATLAEIAHRFMDLSAAAGYEGENLSEVQEPLLDHVTALLIDPESNVKRALLNTMSRLCIQFGPQKANDVLLSHMITYLNDRDWLLRCAFFQHIIGVAKYVGSRSLEEYILPLMIQAITDTEEFVVEKVLQSLTALAQSGLFSKITLWDLITVTAPLLGHPNIWVRYATVAFISSAAQRLSELDLLSVLAPALEPYLRYPPLADPSSTTDLTMALGPPISRTLFEEILSWAAASTQVWDILRLRSINSGSAPRSLSAFDTEKLARFDAVLRWTPFDQRRLLAMKDYIVKASQSFQSSKRRPAFSKVKSRFQDSEGSIHLQSLGFTPHIEFFNAPANIPPHEPSSVSRPRRMQDYDMGSRLSLVTGRPHSFHTPELRKRSNTLAQLASAESLNRPRSFSNQSSTNQAGTSGTNVRSFTNPSPVSERETHTPRSSKLAINSKLNDPNGAIPNLIEDQNHTKSMDSPTSAYSQNSTQAINSVGSNAMGRLSSKNTYIAFFGIQGLQSILNKKERDTFPVSQSDFGQYVKDSPAVPTPSMINATNALKSRLASPSTTTTWSSTSVNPGASQTSGTDWVPEGKIVNHLSEHMGAINVIRVSPDHQFFVSGSDDGTIKVWDAHRLDRSITSRSRLTYFKLGGRITCLTFIKNTYCVAAANDKGDVHVFRIDLNLTDTSDSHQASSYSNCNTVRIHRLEGEHALTIEHFINERKSWLIITTNICNIYCINLRTSQVAYKFKNSLRYGTISSVVIDPAGYWLLVGTMKGILVLWDLRFGVSLRKWLHPAQCIIRQLHNANLNQVWIVAGQNNEVSLWDISALECRRVVMASVPTVHQLSEISLKPLETGTDEDLLCSSLEALESPAAFPEHLAPPTILAITLIDSESLISVGTDQIIRFFHFSHPTRSRRILPATPAVYRVVEHDTVPVLFESGASHTNPPTSDHPFSSRSHAKQSLPSILAHHVVQPHLNAITDVQRLQFPLPLLVTGDRSGVIKIIL